MKVLKKGNDQVGWTTSAKCTGSGNGGGGCKAELEVSVGDLFKTYSSHYDGSNETYVTFRCPCCRVLTDIANVPGSVYGEVAESERALLRSKAQPGTNPPPTPPDSYE